MELIHKELCNEECKMEHNPTSYKALILPNVWSLLLLRCCVWYCCRCWYCSRGGWRWDIFRYVEYTWCHNDVYDLLRRRNKSDSIINYAQSVANWYSELLSYYCYFFVIRRWYLYVFAHFCMIIIHPISEVLLGPILHGSDLHKHIICIS